jgi:ABC-type transporter Mla subunit MlaD
MSPQAKRASFVLLTIVAVVFLGWAIKASFFVHDRTLRSRLTLTVETPEGVRTGSSVTEQTITFGPFQLRYGSGE